MSTLPRLNPFLPEFIADPYTPSARYREVDPVHWGIAASPRLPGAWYVFRRADVMRVLEDVRFGRDPQRARGTDDAPPVPAPFRNFRSVIENWMVFKDPPDHRRLRGLVSQAFTPRMIDSIRPTIVAIARDLLDDLEGRSDVDLVEQFAMPLPVFVIASLLGVSPADAPHFRQWSLALADASASRLTPQPETYARAERATQSLVEYFARAVGERRVAPRQDLISEMVRAKDRDDRLRDDEILATCIHLLTAGHETTVNLIAKGILALLRDSASLGWLRAHRAAMPSAIEEILRYDSPVQLVTRWAYEDLAIGETPVLRGHSVGLMLGAANRDPEAFENPDRLDFQRSGPRHASFGGGIHYCLGASLSRLEGADRARRTARTLSTNGPRQPRRCMARQHCLPRSARTPREAPLRSNRSFGAA